MKIELDVTKPGAAQQTAPVQSEAKDTGAVVSTVKVEPSAVEQLEAAQNPKKHDFAPELLTPRGIAIQNDQVKRTIDETADAKNEQLKAVAAEVLAEASEGKTTEIKGAIAEAVNAVMEKFLPAFERLAAPRPAEVAALEKEAADKARNKREWDREKYQLNQTKLAQKQAQARCQHLDSNGHSRLQVCHNQPSRLPIAWCNACQIKIEPNHYMVLPPGIKTKEAAVEYIRQLVAEGEIPSGTPFFDNTGGYILVAEHPLYHLVRALESQASMGVV